jgi:hypothetical protein
VTGATWLAANEAQVRALARKLYRRWSLPLGVGVEDLEQSRRTAVVVEVRGADGFANSDVLYNPGFTSPTPGFTPSDAFNVRGNLLNANYACEAYRYSTANFTGGVPRVAAQGLTRYVTEDQLALIRNESTNLLPRFLNVRVTMTNNVDVSPSLSPSLRSMSLVYRMSGN